VNYTLAFALQLGKKQGKTSVRVAEEIQAQRIRWLGHVKRMEVGAMPRKMIEGRLFIGRRKGRPV
jgi:hypothetical protein